MLPIMIIVPTEIVEVSVVAFDGTGMIATTEIVEVRVVVAVELDRLDVDVGVVVDAVVEEGVELVALIIGCGVGNALVIVENEVWITTGVTVDWTEFTPPGRHVGKPPM